MPAAIFLTVRPIPFAVRPGFDIPALLCYIRCKLNPLYERTDKMTLDEAIKTALHYEGRVIAVYFDAMHRSQDPIAKKVFKTLNEDEASHVRYLKEKLDELTTAGRVKPGKLATTIPPAEKIGAALKDSRGRAASPASEEELNLLRRALALEIETCEFYQKMARDLPTEDRALFERFVEIEEGHRAIVQAEIDSITGTSFWFDIPEFRLEAG
jgi:rubrerythrin